MNEVKVYDGDGKLKKVISRDDLIKRSAGMLNAPPPVIKILVIGDW